MEGYLRLIFLLIAALLVIAVVFIVIKKNQRKSEDKNPILHEEPTISSFKDEPPPPQTSDLLVINIFAKSGTHFASYELLQAILATGMKFGDMNIFHYYSPTSSSNQPLFSLASATEPGEFDLDRMGEFSCTGLTLFMDLRRVPDPEEAFELMLATAEELADDLEGSLYAYPRAPWNEEVLQQYQNKVAAFQTTKRA